MAKKTARSKGYRKQRGPKPYLNKKEIIALCVIVVALVAAAIALFSYDDGALKVKNGAVVTEGDNWLIANGSNTRGRARYFRIGEIGEIEGYTRRAQGVVTDANIPEYIFEPAEEGGAIASIAVTTSHSPADALAEYTQSVMAGVEDTEASELQRVELGGRELVWYTYTVTPAAEEGEENEAEPAETEAEAAETEAEPTETEAEPAETEAEPAETEAEPADDASAEAEPADNAEADNATEGVTRSFSGYFDVAHDNCVVIHVDCVADSAQALPSDEALIAAAEQAVAAITLDEVK